MGLWVRSLQLLGLLLLEGGLEAAGVSSRDGACCWGWWAGGWAHLSISNGKGSVKEGQPGSDPGAQAFIRTSPCAPTQRELWRSVLHAPPPSRGQHLRG